jgi:branched-chain amino acid transport system substrate-binding protein
MDHISRRCTISTAAIALLAASLSGCNRMPDTIKIGVAQPLSGGLAESGKDMVNGVQLAINELNKQGFKVDGKSITLEMVAMDDKSSPEEGKKIAQALVDAGVVAVIGHMNSDVSIAAAPIYAKKGIAELAISTNPQFTTLGHPTAMRLVANDDLQARAISVYTNQHIEATKFAVVDDGTLYGKGLADASAKLLDGKKTVSLRQSYDEKTKDFTPLADKLKADGIQVVISALDETQIAALIEALVKINYNKQITILGTDTLKTTDMLKHANNVGALYVTSPVLEASEFPGGKAFLDAYQAAYKIAPVYGGHYSYDATYVLASAIKRAGNANPEKITDSLRQIDGYGPVTGTMKWNNLGELRYGVVSVYVARNGKWESIVRSDNW